MYFCWMSLLEPESERQEAEKVPKLVPKVRVLVLTHTIDQTEENRLSMRGGVAFVRQLGI